MPFTMPNARREDILAEGRTVLDGSGAYTGDWIDSAGVYSIRVALDVAGNTNSKIEEGVYDPDESGPYVVRSQTVGTNDAYVELSLTARFFRLVLDGGSNGAAFVYAIRAV